MGGRRGGFLADVRKQCLRRVRWGLEPWHLPKGYISSTAALPPPHQQVFAIHVPVWGSIWFPKKKEETILLTEALMVRWGQGSY
jgi:hypothetical protein